MSWSVESASAISWRYRGSKMCNPWTTCVNRTRFGSGNSRAVPLKSARLVGSFMAGRSWQLDVPRRVEGDDRRRSDRTNITRQGGGEQGGGEQGGGQVLFHLSPELVDVESA